MGFYWETPLRSLASEASKEGPRILRRERRVGFMDSHLSLAHEGVRYSLPPESSSHRKGMVQCFLDYRDSEGQLQ